MTSATQGLRPMGGHRQVKGGAVWLRCMIRRDMPEVLEIERRSFEYPWSKADFVRALQHRNALGQVAEIDDRVVGFMVFALYGTRIELWNLAVAPDCRRQGVGRAMIAERLKALSAQRRHMLAANVREHNLAAQVFFRELAFRCVAVMRRFYDDTPDGVAEDAYRMVYRLGGFNP